MKKSVARLFLVGMLLLGTVGVVPAVAHCGGRMVLRTRTLVADGSIPWPPAPQKTIRPPANAAGLA